ncbi:hypothetical protein LNQ03_15690 [Klebsiella pneumoniae subsp. pneumoniae]|nr:hypothetical protein [Klebsiella pneumoniae subsp. pneumoniae]
MNGTTCSSGRRVFTLIAIFLLNHFAGFTKGQGPSVWAKEVRQQFLMVVRQRVVGDSAERDGNRTVLPFWCPGGSAGENAC